MTRRRVRLVKCPEEVYKAIEDYDTLKVAHNAEFDAAIAIHVLGIDTRLCDWYDTAYVAAYYGLPRKLGFLANVLKTQAKASPEQMLHYAKPVKKAAPADSMDLFGVPTDTEYNEMKERFSVSFEKSVSVGRYNEDVRDVETAEHLRVCLEYVQGLRNSPMVKSVMQYGPGDNRDRTYLIVQTLRRIGRRGDATGVQYHVSASGNRVFRNAVYVLHELRRRAVRHGPRHADRDTRTQIRIGCR